MAVEAREKSGDWLEMWNRLYGVGGPFCKLFPEPRDRTAFVSTDEYRRINELMDQLPEKGKALPDASGKLLLRLPQSIHAALMVEAEAEGVSVNQLILAKCSAQLRAVVG